MRAEKEGDVLKESPLSTKEEKKKIPGRRYQQLPEEVRSNSCLNLTLLCGTAASASQVLRVNQPVPARGKNGGKVAAAAIAATSTCVSSEIFPWRIIFYILR